MTGLAFTKMHGLGNDFVVLDGRRAPLALDAARARAIADRRTGVGCDQLITILPPRMDGADAFMLILNADGDEVEACGNGARCVASILMGEAGAERTVIETVVGLLPAERGSNGAIAVDMGEARLGWREIPLAAAADTLALDVTVGPLSAPAPSIWATRTPSSSSTMWKPWISRPTDRRSNITRCFPSAPMSR